MSNSSSVVPKTIQQNREKYMHALRSGKYKQARGIYYDPGDNSFCAIGCALHALGKHYKACVPNFDEISELLHIHQSDVEEIVEMNDEYEMSFHQIADALERAGMLTDRDYRDDLLLSFRC